MLTKLSSATAVAVLALGLVTLGAGSLRAEQKGSGPTQAQIDCKNRAVNDYWDQLKACDQVLSDLPADNAQCHSDAADDLHRRQAACTAQMTAGSVGGQGVLGTGTVLDAGAKKTFRKTFPAKLTNPVLSTQ
jgi:hypothetical protein